MATLFEIYKEAIKKLDNKAKDEINVRLLLCANNHLDNMSEFYLRRNDNIQDLPKFESEFSRFLNGEPIDYILGETEFFGSKFNVDKRVLIPRSETEEVASFALRKILKIYGDKPLVLADICSGSGCIGISLAKHLKLKALYLSDISKEANEVAFSNLLKNNVDGLIFEGDGLKPLIKHNVKVDVIVSNPPYILNKNEVDESVLLYEPHNALFTSNNLDVYRSILLDAHKVMNDELLIIFEIGYDLKDKLIELLKELNYDCQFTFSKDINGKYRIFSLLIKSKIEA